MQEGYVENLKEIRKSLLAFSFVNAFFINGIWWFMFMFGRHLGADSPEPYSSVFENVYTISILSGFLLLIFSLGFLRFNQLILGKTMSWIGIILTVINPSVLVVYVIINFCLGYAGVPNLTAIPIELALTWLNFVSGKPIINKLISVKP